MMQAQHESDILNYIGLSGKTLPQRITTAIMTLLNKESLEYPVVFKDVQIHFGPKYTQPLVLCEILRRYDMDLYLCTWAPIYCDAINNGQQAEQVALWRERGFSDEDINFKLYTYCRSILFSERDDSGEIRLCVRELIFDLDNRLIKINESRIVSIKKESDRCCFLFARSTPGLLEAIFAQLALYEHNYSVAEYFANESIDFSKNLAQQEEPSYLGYLLLAQVIWHTRLKDKTPEAADVIEFQKNIQMARTASNPKELSYIEAEILLSYMNSKYHAHWVDEVNLRVLNGEAKDQAVYLKIEEHLERALEGNMYPLAVMLFARDLLCWKSSENQKSYEDYIEKSVDYLEVACLVHGFVLAFYEYAKLGLRNPHPTSQWGERDYVLDTAEAYLTESEKYIYIDPAQRRNLSQQIAEYKQTNYRFSK